MDGAARRQPGATTPRSSVTSSGDRWKARGPTGSPSRRRSSRRTSRRSASTRSRRIAISHARALGSVSRAYYDADARADLRGVQLSRASSRTSARSRPGDRRGRAHRATSRDRSIYTVTLARLRPARRHVYYTTDNGAYRDLVPARSRDRPDEGAAEGRAHRRPRVQPRRSVAVGHPPSQRPLHDRADGGALHGVDAGARRSPTAR